MTAKREQWAERVRGWRASGQTAREFATGREYAAEDLHRWAYRLKELGARTRAATRSARRTAPNGVKLIRVAPIAQTTPAPTALTVEIGAARLRIPTGNDQSMLRATIFALLAARGGGAR